MGEEWLQLTEEDIARAQRLTRAQPPMPEVITITPADLQDQPQPLVSDSILTISIDDLAPIGPQATTSEDVAVLERLMFELVNSARSNHLPGWLTTSELKWHVGLAAIARGHSQDMLKRQYVSHISPEGVTAARRLDGQHIRYVACGENIGVFYGDAAATPDAVREIHNAFMSQPRSLSNHRGNLLNPIWTHVGIGIALNPDGALVATQNFISAPAARVRGR